VLTERSIVPEERRSQILAAAARVFARRGFHTSRVGDVAREAGISHGLLYHYFSSKDELLEAIFAQAWTDLLAAISVVEESEQPAREQLRQVAAILLRAWRHEPDLVRVIVCEIGRSPKLASRLEEMRSVNRAVERIIRRGQERGELRDDVNPALAATIFYGGVDEILTSWVFGLAVGGDDAVARAERTLVDVVCGGLAVGAPTLA
jgi:TetR/AcrR family transcriptional regulator, fatty acid metabolism regulator protein